MNKRFNNKEETTYRGAKERKARENYKKVNRYLKNTLNQRDNTNSLQYAPIPAPLWRGEDYLKVSQTTAGTENYLWNKIYTTHKS
jgi:hypothetical protein